MSGKRRTVNRGIEAPDPEAGSTLTRTPHPRARRFTPISPEECPSANIFRGAMSLFDMIVHGRAPMIDSSILDRARIILYAAEPLIAYCHEELHEELLIDIVSRYRILWERRNLT